VAERQGNLWSRLKDGEPEVWSRVIRFAWWVLVLVGTVVLIYWRFDHLTSKRPSDFDTGVLGLAAILLLSPFISEISAFGFTVKKQIEEAKAEVRGEVRDRISVVRDEMLTLPISSRATASVNLLGAVPYPPPDDKLGELALHYASLLDKYRQDFGLVGAAADVASVSDDAVYAFKERFSIEREVRRLWNTRAVRGDFVRYPGLSRMLDDLTMYEVVPPPLV